MVNKMGTVMTAKHMVRHLQDGQLLLGDEVTGRRADKVPVQVLVVELRGHAGAIAVPLGQRPPDDDHHVVPVDQPHQDLHMPSGCMQSSASMTVLDKDAIPAPRQTETRARHNDSRCSCDFVRAGMHGCPNIGSQCAASCTSHAAVCL